MAGNDGYLGSGPSGVPLNGTTVAQFSTASAQFGATASGTVGNTVAETTLVGTGIGSQTVAANTFTVGRSMLIYAWGNMGSTLTPTLQIRGKVGAVTALDSGAVTLPVITGTTLWQLSMYITCRTAGAGGTAIAQGIFTYFTAANVQTNFQLVNTGTFAMDTTAALLLNVTAQWSAADPLNTLTSTNFSCLRLG